MYSGTDFILYVPVTVSFSTIPVTAYIKLESVTRSNQYISVTVYIYHQIPSRIFSNFSRYGNFAEYFRYGIL